MLAGGQGPGGGRMCAFFSLLRDFAVQYAVVTKKALNQSVDQNVAPFAETRERALRGAGARRLLRHSGRLGLFVGLLSATSGAQEATPTEGFALSPIEPSVAGDRFFLTPDAASHSGLSAEEDFPLRALVFSHLSLGAPLRQAGTEVVERQLWVHAGLSYTPVSWLLLHADLPLLAIQESSPAVASGAALGDLRLGVRAGLVGHRRSAWATAPSVDVWVPTGSREHWTGDGALRAQVKWGVSGQASVFVYSAQVGYLFRKNQQIAGWEVGSSVTFDAAVGLSLFDDILQIGPEVQGRFLTSSSQDRAWASETSPVHGLIGARVHVGPVQFGVGYGPGVSWDGDQAAPGTASRLFASLAIVPRAQLRGSGKVSLGALQDSDGDGFPDTQDACPEQAGTIEWGEWKGCPEDVAGAFAQRGDVDSDGDGIFDDEDACPNLWGAAADEPAHHGCPETRREELPKAPVSAEVDTDGDGVPDAEDACPQQPGVAQAQAGVPRGCPAQKEAARPLRPRKRAAAKVGERSEASFVGLRQLSAEKMLVFVELSQEAKIETKRQGKLVEVRISGAQVSLRNNRNPLLAQHFGTAVESAQLLPVGKDAVKLVVRLNAEAQVETRLERHAEGATLKVEVTGVAKSTGPAR